MNASSNNTSLLSSQDIQTVDGEYCLTAEQIAKGLGYNNYVHINRLIERHLDEIEPYRFSVKLSQNPLSNEGGRPSYLLYSEEGIYIICMLARTPKAKEFRKQVAAILKGLRQQQIRELEEKLEAKRIRGKKCNCKPCTRYHRPDWLPIFKPSLEGIEFLDLADGRIACIYEKKLYAYINPLP
uniref:Hypothetical phage protein n=1 Tax=Candidatus Magnetobacterium bavaricum TaxID=29290 RepID=D7GXF8_9BACT|nr:Hypothetical phage protein [Candidatus Magnetobacterium bavaricum]